MKIGSNPYPKFLNPSHKQVTNGWLRLRKIDLRSETPPIPKCHSRHFFMGPFIKNVPPREEHGQAHFDFSLPRSPVCCHLFTSRVNSRGSCRSRRRLSRWGC
jgi:hypothetical protein